MHHYTINSELKPGDTVARSYISDWSSVVQITKEMWQALRNLRPEQVMNHDVLIIGKKRNVITGVVNDDWLFYIVQHTFE